MGNIFLKKIILLLLFLETQSLLASLKTANRAYKRGRYVKATSLYYDRYTNPKNLKEKTKSEWGLAESLRKLGLFYSASKYYSVIVRRGSIAKNIYFRQAMEALGDIDATVSLGYSHVVQLFRKQIDPAKIPDTARGFYFFYQGVEVFGRKNYNKSKKFFNRVPFRSFYYYKSLFYLAVIGNLQKNYRKAVSYFQKVRSLGATFSAGGEWLSEIASLNIARIYYEEKKYKMAIRYYAEIPRDSDNWLQALFESAWAFFLMEKHNNTLGNIHTLHSPFFVNRFFPESYILQSVTFLKLCRLNEVSRSVLEFKKRYKNIFNLTKKILKYYRSNKSDFYKLVSKYKNNKLRKYKALFPILDALSRTDTYREAGRTIRFSNNELRRLSKIPKQWDSSGLETELLSFLRKKKSAAISSAGRKLYNEGVGYYRYLLDLSGQTQLINAEVLVGKVDKLRNKIKTNYFREAKNSIFIGGMQELDISQKLEYWPVEHNKQGIPEVWRDELGYYVANVKDKCQD